MRFCNLNRYQQRDIKYDGILGGNILRKLAWKIDFEKREIIAAQSSKVFGVNEADGIPFRVHGSHPWFACNINGVPVTVMLDTGFDGFVSINNGLLDSVPEASENAIAWRGFSTTNTHNPSVDFSPKGIEGTFRSRQPPLRPYGEKNLSDWTQAPAYYY